jgi:hypothetical protein
MYLSGAGADPFPSPSVNPRNVTDAQPFAFGDACLYTSTFTAADDDGGSASDDVQVIVAGNAEDARGDGYWQTQYRPRPTALEADRRACYLEIVGALSAVFDEQRPAATVAQAYDVLHLGGSASARDQLDRSLLVAWLNFANGAHELDASFTAVMAAAEAVRNNPAATRSQLQEQKRLVEALS